MRRDVIATCPVCQGELQVTRLSCTTCGTGIDGHFTVGRFSRLNQEQTAMLESFLRARGNLREMERELGISYPTVRNRVEALVRALGLADGGAPLPPPDSASAGATIDAASRREILERLARHELTAEQAAAALRGGQGQSRPTASASASATGTDEDTDTREED
ncbi:MAG TPA: DUF2089 domain-containing protein [Candidatus Limnocylindria bacterium]|nr:DUF2089 domain-containing protein [Candidatus Limnocylindria bacterium]